MLFKNLQAVIEDAVLEDDKLIRVQGVRDGKEYVLYEAWSSDDELVLSVAEKGSDDYLRVIGDFERERVREVMKEKITELEALSYSYWKDNRNSMAARYLDAVVDKLNDEVEWTHTQGELEQFKFDEYEETAINIGEGEKGMTIYDAEQEFGHHLTEGLSAS